jgi:hypothetical protein
MNLSSMSLMTVMLASLVAACAHSKPSKEPVASVPVPEPASTANPSSPKNLRMSLPYRFTRRGVEIQVNYVEVVNGELQVNIGLQETRGETAELIASTLMQARTPDGQGLPYRSYLQDKTAHENPEINLTPNQKLSVNLAFQAPTTPGMPIELQFPTGKWWSSGH